MVIGIDIDDTIAKTSEAIDLYAKEYTENILKRDFTLNMVDIYDPMWAKHVYSWSIEEDNRFWNLYYEKITKNIKPKEDAIEIINKLYKNNKIIIISARWDRKSGIINKITEEWLKNYNIYYDSLYMNHQDKRNIAKDNKIDLLIDDSIKTCIEIESIGIKTFLMNSRINEHIDAGKITRVNSWFEIYEKIEKIL